MTQGAPGTDDRYLRAVSLKGGRLRTAALDWQLHKERDPISPVRYDFPCAWHSVRDTVRDTQEVLI